MLKSILLLIGLIYPVLGLDFNVGSSNHDSAWVNNQTSLTGGTVNINVGGKTTLTGAEIAAGNYDDNGNFVDNGQLEFATNDLEYKDLQDFNTSNERGFGISTSLGGSTDKGKASLAPQGSTTISMKDKGSESEQVTRATIGMGNITVGGNELAGEDPALAGLNRNTDNAQEIARDMITGALDGSVTVDNRIFSESGREQIADQHEHLVDNAIIAGAGAYGTVEGAVKFAGDVAGLGETEYDKNGNIVETSAVNKWKANQSGMATGIGRGGSEEAQKIIGDMKDGFVSPEDLQKLAAMTSDGSVNLVYSNDSEVITFIDKDGNVLGAVARSGMNDLENHQGYVNLANGAGTDAYTFLFTDAEERAHNYVGDNEKLAKSAASNEMDYYNWIADMTGGYTVSGIGENTGFGTNTQNQYNQQYNTGTNTLLQTNTAQASAVKGPTADSIVRIVPALYYMGADGLQYKAATEKVASELPLINQLDEAVHSTLMLPIELLDSLTSNGMIVNVFGVAGQEINDTIGEDHATFLFDVLDGVAIGSTLKGVRGEQAHNPANTNIFWKDVSKTDNIDTVASKPIKGGAYPKVKEANKNSGRESHHMPANSLMEDVKDIPPSQRPVVSIEKVDHMETGSYGNNPKSNKYRSDQKIMIEQGKIRDVVAQDIWDLKKNTGTKYNNAIQQYMDYLKTLDTFNKNP